MLTARGPIPSQVAGLVDHAFAAGRSAAQPADEPEGHGSSCPSGKYAAGIASTKCALAQDGKYSGNSAASACPSPASTRPWAAATADLCPKASTATKKHEHCTSCPSGYSGARAHTRPLRPCAPGRKHRQCDAAPAASTRVLRRNACQGTAVSSLRASRGQGSVRRVKASGASTRHRREPPLRQSRNKYSSATGASTRTRATCPAGQLSDPPDSCVSCIRANTWTDPAAPTAPAGFQNQPAQTSCKSYPVGKHQDELGRATCKGSPCQEEVLRVGRADIGCRVQNCPSGGTRTCRRRRAASV